MPHLNLQLVTGREALCPVCCCNLTSPCTTIRNGIAVCFPCARSVQWETWRNVHAAAEFPDVAHWWTRAHGISLYTPPTEIPHNLAVHVAACQYRGMKPVPVLPEFSADDDRDQT